MRIRACLPFPRGGSTEERCLLIFTAFLKIDETEGVLVCVQDITRQLLGFARQQTVDPRVLDLNDTVEETIKMLRRLIGEDIDLSWQPGPGQMSVFMDPSQLDQILANLCVNARDAIGGVGRVTIETGRVRFDAQYCADHAGFVPEASVDTVGVNTFETQAETEKAAGDLGARLRDAIMKQA